MAEIKTKDISDLDFNKPMASLEETLECMKDPDPFIAMAGREYYKMYYLKGCKELSYTYTNWCN